MSELVNCVCGGKAELKKSAIPSWHIVYCTNCKLSTGFCPSIDDAITIWNRMIRKRKEKNHER